MNVQVEDKLRVLVTGYSAQGHTSFGSQIRELWTRLLRTGKYEVVQHGWFHSTKIEGVPWQIIPTNNTWDDQGRATFMPEDKWGQKSFVRVCQQVKPQLVWTLADIYMVEHLGMYRRSMGYKYIQNVPVDGTPCPPRYKEIVNNADLTVGIAQFGSEALNKLTGRQHPYIWHGVDTETFYPYPDHYRQQIREQATGGRLEDDAIIFGWVGKDQTRKQPYNLFEFLYYLRSGNYSTCNSCSAVTRYPFDKMIGKAGPPPEKCHKCQSTELSRGTPQNVYFWCHAYNQPQQAYDFERMIETFGLQDKVIFTTTLSRDSGLKTKEVADLYNCLDVFVSFSGGEGFGIPLIEAQACGVPVLYTDYSGQSEISNTGGLPVDVLELVPEPITHIDRAVTDMNHAIQQFNKLMSNKKLYNRLKKSGRARMVDDFNYDLIAQQWDETIQEIMAKNLQVMGVCS